MAADLAESGDADPAARERRCAVEVVGRGPHALEDAPGGQDRAVAGATVLDAASGHEPGLAGDHVHVVDVRTDVARGVVATAEGLDHPAVRAQQ